ncbi:hypothetical protein CLV25_11086 [Acetobacteroides hydrogenigenes]|uniref:Uncharacterized protein n=1 Tax=Acetobacteroides hydrogenigenes TaxID=979970 RepID=A0A4R2EEY1_9BACT|nr:hypothetical protein CLV25_11086 [Acetobacteroides hydrogenigenes]
MLLISLLNVIIGKLALLAGQKRAYICNKDSEYSQKKFCCDI